MDYNELIDQLKNLEAIAYGYNINGEVLGMDCSDFEQIMVDAAESITDLLARVEASEDRAEKAERERDEAIHDICKMLGEIEEIRFLPENDLDMNLSELCEDYCSNTGYHCYKQGEKRKCMNFKWRGLEE